MEREELIKYAELIIAMSTDFLTGGVSEKHYKNMLKLVNKNLEPEITEGGED